MSENPVRPRVSVFIATSLDGFIAREDGAIDWLTGTPAPEGEDFGYAAFMATVDALVMGRVTFEQVLGFDEWPYGPLPVVVLTTHALTVPAALRDRVTVADGEPAAVLAELAARGVHHVYVDGGETIRRFLATGCVDEITLTRLPVLLGAGRPLFGPTAGDVALNHLETRTWANGYVQSRYRVGAAG